MVKAVKAISGVIITTERVEIDDDVPYKLDILPEDKTEINRAITIGHRAQVNGKIFGKEVIIKSGSPEIYTKAISVYGESSISIGDHCAVAGHVQSNGCIKIGEQTGRVTILGDVIGRDITIFDDCKIAGSIVAAKNLTIGNNVEIGGVAFAENMALGNNSKVFDIFASKDLIIGENCCIIDPVVWVDEGKIELSKMEIGSYSVSKDSKNIVKAKEINPYYTASNLPDFIKILDELNGAFTTINKNGL